MIAEVKFLPTCVNPHPPGHYVVEITIGKFTFRAERIGGFIYDEAEAEKLADEINKDILAYLEKFKEDDEEMKAIIKQEYESQL